MISKITSILFPPFSISEVDPFVIVDKQGTKILEAVDPLVAESLLELLNAGNLALGNLPLSNTYDIEMFDHIGY